MTQQKQTLGSVSGQERTLRTARGEKSSKEERALTTSSPDLPEDALPQATVASVYITNRSSKTAGKKKLAVPLLR